MTRVLVVNADDFGRSPGINRGVARAHAEGIVTSASLMVRYPHAADAAAYGRGNPDISVGLHVDLGEWTQTGDAWATVYELSDVAAQVELQLEAFRRLMDGDPTHVDSHQHVHRHGEAQAACAALAARLGVPLRHFSAVRYLGDFYGQAKDASPIHEGISVDALVALIRSLPDGATELCCHPGEPERLASSYTVERPMELETLCDPRVRRAIEEEGIALRSFRDALSST